MIVRFDKSFSKAIERIKDRTILKRIEAAILKAETATTIDELTNTRKLIGYSVYYRIKIGEYRIGFESINNNEIRLVTVLHRKDIYKKFP